MNWTKPERRLPGAASRCVLLLVALLLFGCSAKHVSDLGGNVERGNASGKWDFPVGVAVPVAHRGDLEVDGIYPSMSPSDGECCLVSNRSKILTIKPRKAPRVKLSIRIPDYPFFKRHPQALFVSIDGDKPQVKCCLEPGFHVVAIALPPRVRDHIGEVLLVVTTRYALVPSKEHISPDSRQLAFVLLSVDYGP